VSTFFEWLADVLRQAKLWTVINLWERGVRVRRGNSAVLLRPGWHWRIPIVDNVLLFNNRLRIMPVPAQTIQTRDARTISVAAIVGFRIDDPLEAMLSVQQPEHSCAAFVQTATAKYIAERTLDEIVLEELQDSATTELGIYVSGIVIEFVRVIDYAVINRTFRVLGDEWRPQTKVDTHDKE
jgi:regulator of protease activity HflC (stomatin/prohibitin superfamily)